MNFQEICSGADSASAKKALAAFVSGDVYAESVSSCCDGGVVFMSCEGAEKKVHLLSPQCGCGCSSVLEGEKKEVELGGQKLTLITSTCDHAAAVVIRKLLPWSKPKCLGLDTSIGLGDRLGLATPGHVRAVQGSGVMPILAQQSIREMTRTLRNPDQVMDCATFGVLQAGWREGFGSDADHLKSPEDIDYCLKAGFTLYTIDPGDHVVNAADSMSDEEIAKALDNVPWGNLDTTLEKTKDLYAGKTFDLDGGLSVEISEDALLRATVKYGPAVAHTARMKQHLETEAAKIGHEWELEMSVDETDSDTSPVEHFYVASELKRLGVHPVSLAPRFVGDFEKGVDYQGDLAVLERDFILHAAIARKVGPYKISLHSGSDKFSVYPIAAKHAGSLVHVKTAGTSYLEALRAIAKIDPALFREILSFARDNYEVDKQSYHVSAKLEKVMKPEEVADDGLVEALNQFDTRQAFHVTFGSVLTRKGDNDKYLFRDRFYAALENNEEVHFQCLAEHLGKHVAPFKK